MRVAQRVIATEGPAELTVQKIAAGAGATIGSVYHRFPSLDAIQALAWIEAAEAFQGGFLDAIAKTNLFESVRAGALYTPDFARRDLLGARTLLRFDAAGLKALEPGPALVQRIHRLERQLRRALGSLLKRSGTRSKAQGIALLQFLLVEMPLAAIKPHLRRGQAPPAQVDSLIGKTVDAFAGDLK